MQLRGLPENIGCMLDDVTAQVKGLLASLRTHFKDIWIGFEGSLKWLGDRRDGLLLVGGGLYFLGYLSWALYGGFNNIGWIPVLDTQYFAAGIIPAIIIFVFVLSKRLLRSFGAWLKGEPTTIQQKLSKIFTACAFAGMTVGVVLRFIVLRAEPAWLYASVVGAVVILYLGAIVGRRKGILLLQWASLIIIGLYVYTGPIILSLLYIDKIMPRVGPEWGGARASCSHLDVDVSQISLETRRKILEEGDRVSTEGVFRTMPVYLIFDGNEYLFLSEYGEKPSPTNRVYRLRKDAVKGIFPCSQPAKLHNAQEEHSRR